MRSSVLLLAIFIPLQTGAASEAHLDFTKTHTFASVAASGLLYQESPKAADPGGGRTYLLQAQKLQIDLPGGLQLRQTITHGSFTTQGELMETFQCYGEVLPVEDAAQIVRALHAPLKIDNAKLDDWFQKSSQAGQHAKSFITGPALKFYPMMTVEILPSMNAKYPVMMSLGLGWNLLEEERDRSEKWGLVNNPRPAADARLVSLDSPSGKSYDRTEFWAELKEKEERTKEARQKAAAPGIITGSGGNPPGPPLADTAEESALQRGWLWILLLPGVGIVWMLARKKAASRKGDG